MLRRLWHRLPWLGVGLVGALLAAGVVGNFEADLAEHVLIAFFVPGVVYLADAIGTQTEALVIRGLSLGVGVRQIVGREIATGVLLGLILGGVSLLVVGSIWQDWHVALAVALSLLAAASIATVIALVLPWVISKLGKDPAFGSGPLATVTQDLLTGRSTSLLPPPSWCDVPPLRRRDTLFRHPTSLIRQSALQPAGSPCWSGSVVLLTGVTARFRPWSWGLHHHGRPGVICFHWASWPHIRGRTQRALPDGSGGHCQPMKQRHTVRRQ